jgi:hypothetical protein
MRAAMKRPRNGTPVNNTLSRLLTGPRPGRVLGRVAAVAALCALTLAPAVAHAYTYNPLNIISYDTWRASSSMSVADIQAFLATQSGPLKSLVTTDYVTPGGANNYGVKWTAGQPKKSAAQIIYDACRYWNLNPKVMLATLQKEQSLITVSNSSNAARLIKAVGCGVYGDANHDGKTDNRFPGFGNQIYNGARVFSTYEVTYGWYPGKPKSVTAYRSVDATKSVSGHVVHYTKSVSYTKTIYPLNACTFSLYTYTPYYPQKLFWDLYTRYFGDPQAAGRLRPVYRFRERSNGTYYYTASEAQRYTLIRTSPKKWAYEGVSFTVDTSATANTAPLYQMYNTRTHRYLYTASLTKRASLLKLRPRQWRSDRVVCNVTLDTSGTAPVYSLENRSTHAIKLISSESQKAAMLSGRHPLYTYRGIAFRLGKLVAATPVGPTS